MFGKQSHYIKSITYVMETMYFELTLRTLCLILHGNNGNIFLESIIKKKSIICSFHILVYTKSEVFLQWSVCLTHRAHLHV